MSTRPRTRRRPHRRATRFAVRVVAVGIVAIGIAAALWLRRAQHRSVEAVTEATTGPVQSGKIVGPWSRLDGARWYEPGLPPRNMLIPDRPHNRSELTGARRAGTMKRVRRFTLTTNSDRLRGPELPRKAWGSARVLAVGDSMTAGWGLPFAEAWPAQLEDLLSGAGLDVDVINAGVPANPPEIMGRWCRQVAPEHSGDWVLWARRPHNTSAGPLKEFVEAVVTCARAHDGQLLVLLPPISTFDLHHRGSWPEDGPALTEALAPYGIDVIETTGAFRVAQDGRGVALAEHPEGWAIVDQATGQARATAPTAGTEIPPALLEWLEAHPEAREPLFFDEGHPDAEGQALFAATIAPEVAARLR